MNKQTLYSGIGYAIVGLIFAILGIVRDSSVLFGFAGGLGVPGLMMIYRYFQMTNPQKQAHYQQIATHQRIESDDERRIMLRDRSGRLTYLVGLFAISAVVIGGALLGEFDVIEKTISQSIVLVSSIFLLSQVVIGTMIYRYLDNKL